MTSDYLNQIRTQSTGEERDEWVSYLNLLQRHANLDLVNVNWRVEYDDLTHAIILQYEISTNVLDTFLLQVWAMDQDDGVWIPELHPRETCVVEFSGDQKITKLKGGLIDHEWRKEDSGAKYTAYLWGYVDQLGKSVQFGPFTKKFTYP